MCGIAGFVDFGRSCSGDELRALAQKMADTLRHRGPDGQGLWVDHDSGVALGHCRLAVIDLSPRGAQPMVSSCGRYVISYNGEVYNFKALRRELEELGHGFRGRSDTEVMLAAISQWGLKAALERFNGMFAFALWDMREGLLHLVRDRLGKKPLYYGWVGRSFLFGSELKALRAHPEFSGEIDREALALYLRLNYIPAPYSIYRRVRKLPPGTVLTLDVEDFSSRPEPVAYWSAREVALRGAREPLDEDPEQLVLELDRLLRDAVVLRMEADVDLGAFLSGGIDSSLVVALMQAQSPRPVRTFTIGYHEASYNEAEDAKAVARHLGTDHTELYVRPEEALDVVPRLPFLYDEPFSDSSQIPTALVSQMARRHVTVALAGDAGDELFGGYNLYVWLPRVWRAVGWMPSRLRSSLARALAALSPQTWEAWHRRLSPLMPSSFQARTPGMKIQKLSEVLASSSPEAMYLGLVSHWKEPVEVVLGASEPLTVITDPSAWPELPEFVQKMMYLDMVSFLPDDDLLKVDRASMGVGLEVRVPLLDYRVVEFAWRVPPAFKIRQGQGKWLLRQLLYRYVPRELIERPKMGFEVPLEVWLRGPLRDWAESLLDEGRLRREGFFAPGPIRAKWREHLSGKRSWHYLLWDVLVFQAWLETQ